MPRPYAILLTDRRELGARMLGVNGDGRLTRRADRTRRFFCREDAADHLAWLQRSGRLKPFLLPTVTTL